LEANRIENEMSATNSSKESCGKKTKCAVSSNRHDMDSSMGGKREAAGGGMVAEENHQVENANATMQKEKSSATKMKPRLNYHSNIINRKRKVSEDAILSKQEKASKSKRKKDRCQAEDEMAKKDAKQNEKKKRKKDRRASDYYPAVPFGTDVSDLIHHEANMDDGTDMHITNANDINANANANAHDAHTNAQMPNNQSALAMSEMQKSQVVAANQILRQSCAQARIVINDAMSPVQVATGEEMVAADPFIGITESETEALATMESHFLLAHARQVHPHAHAHHQIHAPHTDGHHHHAYHESITHNAAGLPCRLEEKWESHFRDLAAYKEQHGNCLVPTSTKLGSWLYRQRYNFGHKNLKDERKQRLMELDETCLGAIDNEKWNVLFMELVEYKEKNGHCNCPIKKNGSLGHWIDRQRSSFRSKELKADRYEKLVGIGFVFARQKWNKFFMELEEYKQKNGHCNLKYGPLGSWISTQRTLFISKKLKENRYEKLVGIGFA
jgi:hypothetical protein